MRYVFDPHRQIPGHAPGHGQVLELGLRIGLLLSLWRRGSLRSTVVERRSLTI